MSKRKSISPKVRFEIFKRDKFACRYCGRTTPQVILEVDHIVPVAEGGTNDDENLVTACYECNRGKGAISLEELPEADEDIHERTILLVEREMQLREYNEVMRKIRERSQIEVKELTYFWCEVMELNPATVSSYHVPEASKMITFLETIACEDIKWAMVKAASSPTKTYYQALKYLYAILWNWKREGVNRG